MPKEIEAIGLFIPSLIENAHLSLINLDYFNDGILMLGTSMNSYAADDYDIKNNPALKGYNISYFYLNMSQIDNIHINVEYSYPPSENGAIQMCGPMRNYKLSDLFAKKPNK